MTEVKRVRLGVWVSVNFLKIADLVVGNGQDFTSWVG